MSKSIIRWAVLSLIGPAVFCLFGAFTLWEPNPAAWTEVMRGFVAGATVIWMLLMFVFAAASADDGQE